MRPSPALEPALEPAIGPGLETWIAARAASSLQGLEYTRAIPLDTRGVCRPVGRWMLAPEPLPRRRTCARAHVTRGARPRDCDLHRDCDLARAHVTRGARPAACEADAVRAPRPRPRRGARQWHRCEHSHCTLHQPRGGGRSGRSTKGRPRAARLRHTAASSSTSLAPHAL